MKTIDINDEVKVKIFTDLKAMYNDEDYEFEICHEKFTDEDLKNMTEEQIQELIGVDELTDIHADTVIDEIDQVEIRLAILKTRIYRADLFKAVAHEIGHYFELSLETSFVPRHEASTAEEIVAHEAKAEHYERFGVLLFEICRAIENETYQHVTYV